LREGLFIKRNKDRWERVQHGDADDPDTMARDFVGLVDDLGYAKTFYPRSRVTQYINALASRIYLNIYRNRKEESNRLLNFWKLDMPLAIARNYKILLFSLALFLLFYMIGFYASRHDPELIRGVLGDGYVAETEKNIEEGNPFGIYQGDNPFYMWIFIMIHNIQVAVFAFFQGIFLGIGSVYALVQNSIMVGVFHNMFAVKGYGVDFLFAVMLHGLLELTAIVIACGAGMIMGTSYLFPGTFSRLTAFKNGAKDGVKIILGLMPVFAMAAFYEGFITRYYKMPLWLNIALLMPSALFIIGYLIWYPYTLHRRMKKEMMAS
jgi:uncharacterized membrane protein SpoIIM required for sporulation